MKVMRAVKMWRKNNAFSLISLLFYLFFFLLFVLIRLYKYRNPTLWFDCLQTWVRIYKPPARYPLPWTTSLRKHQVSLRTNFRGKYLDRQFRIQRRRWLGRKNAEEKRLDRNKYKKSIIVSKDIDFRKCGWVVNQHQFRRSIRILFSYFFILTWIRNQVL